MESEVSHSIPAHQVWGRHIVGVRKRLEKRVDRGAGVGILEGIPSRALIGARVCLLPAARAWGWLRQPCGAAQQHTAA
jgi:hypothetical protein